MSTYTDGPRRSFTSETDFRLKQYFIVKLGTAANSVVIAAAATDAIIGVVMNKPNSGEVASVQLLSGGGTGKVVAGGSITKGAQLTADSAGKAVATTTVGNYCLGIALEDGDAGDVVEYMPIGHRRYAATS